MIKPRTVAILDSIIRDSTLDLFSGYGIELFSATSIPATHEHTFATSIGFTNPILPGILALTMNGDLLAQSRPVELQSKVPSDQGLDDWAGELCNQLLGRIKNQLLRHGITLKASVPSTMRGSFLRRALMGASISRKMSFVGGTGSVCVYFDAKTPKSLDLTPPAGGSETLAEGRITLFDD